MKILRTFCSNENRNYLILCIIETILNFLQVHIYNNEPLNMFPSHNLNMIHRSVVTCLRCCWPGVWWPLVLVVVVAR